MAIFSSAHLCEAPLVPRCLGGLAQGQPSNALGPAGRFAERKRSTKKIWNCESRGKGNALKCVCPVAAIVGVPPYPLDSGEGE